LITLVFKENTGEYFARQQVINALNEAILPPGITPSLNPLTGSTGEIYRYTLQSDVKNLMDLSEIQRWIIIPILKQIPGIVEVNNFGGFTKEYQLYLDPQQLNRFYISLEDIKRALENNNRNTGGGRVTRGEQNYILRGLAKITSLKDMGNIFVKTYNNTPIYLKDIGVLKFGHRERQGVCGVNHNPDAVQGIITMRKHENSSEVLKKIHAKIEELQAGLKPLKVKIVPYLDRQNLIDLTIHQVKHTVISGILIVVLILLIFLKDLRCALVVASSIPIALFTMFILIYLTDMSANLFSLGSLDFGVIVDGSIVIMEAILRRHEENHQNILTLNETLETSFQVVRPIFYSTLIIMSSYLPLFAFQQAEGRIFKPMALIICFALFGALICALTLIPGLTYTCLKKPQKIKQNQLLLKWTKQYYSLLNRLIFRPHFAFIASIFILVAVAYLSLTTGSEFLPELNEGALWLQVKLPNGISLEKGTDLADKLRETLLEFPEVKDVVSQLGRSDIATDPWTTSHLEVAVNLHPESRWPKHESREEFIKILNQKFAHMPGFSVGISQPIIDNANELFSGAHSPLVVRIYGDDLTKSRQIAKKIVAILKTIRGTALAGVYQEAPIPQIVIQLNRQKIARYGIDAEQISQLIETTLVGKPITQIYIHKQIYNVTVRFPVKYKSNLVQLKHLTITSPSGIKIPLADLASLRYQSGESTIAHENNDRVVTVRIENRGRDLGSYLAEAKAKIAKQVPINPQKFHLEWGGQFESQARAQKRLIYIFILMLSIISFFLFIEFKKIHLVLIILCILPMATLGGLLTIHLTGETFNISTAVGFIALFGVSIQNGIIMLANIKRVYEKTKLLKFSVLEGASERLRPILMTASVASCGMLPAALATGVGSDVQRNLATVIVGGLIVSTLLTLFILPVFFYMSERSFQQGIFRFFRKNS
jgi:cobalt-zinc-cadmium resistance protein CzcA